MPEQKPADLDLAALDALYQAATPGHWCTIAYGKDGEEGEEGVQIGVIYSPDDRDCTTPLTGHLPQYDENAEYIDYYFGSMVADIAPYRSNSEAAPGADAALIAALHNAWPALRRRLEIGDAAVEVLDTSERLEWARRSVLSPDQNVDDMRRDAARLEFYKAEFAADAARAKLRALRETPDAA